MPIGLSEMPPPRQTQSYLRSLFAARGIAPRHRHGQNFLIDLNLHDLIVKAADVGPLDVVLEVGPGAGALTGLLAEHAAAVVAVEIDPAMAALTAEAVDGRPHVRVLNVDALASKHAIHPAALDAVAEALSAAPGRRLKLVANLPYHVATPIVGNLLVHPTLRPELMVVTIQVEMADRMRAGPGSAAYGGLSVLVGALATCEVVRTLPPTVFWPRPQVDSAIVRIAPDPAKRAAVGDIPWFQEVVRRAFLHRRKNLRTALHTLWRDRWTRPEVDAFLDGLGLDGQARAESLHVEEFLTMARALRVRLGEPPGDGSSQPSE